VEAPAFRPGKWVFRPAGKNSLKEFGFSLGGNAAMQLAPQEIRTFFITSVTAERRNILQSDRMAILFIDVLQENRKKERFMLHEFVVMPNHFHLLITPAYVIQYIKGGFSFRAKKELEFRPAIWQESFTNHRIRDADDYAKHRTYIVENPVRAKLAERAESFPYSSAYPGTELDAVPPALKRLFS